MQLIKITHCYDFTQESRGLWRCGEILEELENRKQRENESSPGAGAGLFGKSGLDGVDFN